VHIGQPKPNLLLLTDGCLVDIGVSQSSLLSPVNVLTPLTASAAVATSAAKPPPSYSNVRILDLMELYFSCVLYSQSHFHCG